MARFDTSRFIEDLDYQDYSYRQLLGPPLILFLLAATVLISAFVITGSPVALGMDFAGGTELRVSPTDTVSGDAAAALTTAFPEEPASIRPVPSDNTYIVTFADTGTDLTAFEDAATTNGFTVQSSSQVSPSFGASAQRLAILGIGIAFAGMSLIVFGLFRSFIPSVAVVASATSDIVVPLGVMSLAGINLSLGTVAALLMLVGYSVDSDILLNDHVLRRNGSFYDSVYTAMETGVSMTLTSLLAVSVLAVGASLLGVTLLRDIGIVLTIGLAVDLVNTYMMNVTLLRWHKFEGVSN